LTEVHQIMLNVKQANNWHHFLNVFGMTQTNKSGIESRTSCTRSQPSTTRLIWFMIVERLFEVWITSQKTGYQMTSLNRVTIVMCSLKSEWWQCYSYMAESFRLW